MELPVLVESAEAWQALQADIEKMGAAMVNHDGRDGLRPGLPVEVIFSKENGEFVRAKGEVIHLYEGQVALGFAEEEKKTLVGTPFDKKDSASDGHDSSVALWKRYESLTKVDKIKLARQGNADGRRRVLKDRDPSLHLFVLQNPGLKAGEIAAFVRSGFVNPELLKRIIAKKNLISSHDVVDAIVNNPTTPIPMAVSLLPRLRVETVRRIAKQGRLRDAIVKAARKRVITR